MDSFLRTLRENFSDSGEENVGLSAKLFSRVFETAFHGTGGFFNRKFRKKFFKNFSNFERNFFNKTFRTAFDLSTGTIRWQMFLRKSFPIVFEFSLEEFRSLGGTFSPMLTKLNSTCPEEHFGVEKNVKIFSLKNVNIYILMEWFTFLRL